MSFQLVACSKQVSTFQIIDLAKPGDLGTYRERFEEGYYDIDARGNLDIVLRRREPSPRGGGENLTQYVHIHGIWNSIPGRTVAEGSQLNGSVTYAIVDGETGSAFDGAGAVFVHFDRGRETLSGSLEQARIRPMHPLAGRGQIFERADISGRFHARRDRRRVIQLVNDMHRRFGASAAYTPHARPAP